MMPQLWRPCEAPRLSWGFAFVLLESADNCEPRRTDHAADPVPENQFVPKTKYARSDDVLIAYQVTGEGPVDVVMAPGTMSHLDLDWEIPRRALFFQRFSRFCRLIRFDKRGTGLSDRPLHMATLEERADDIRAVMDAAGSQQSVIFGASEGASMAALFAAAQPDRTRSLMIWGGQARWVQAAGYPWGMGPDENERMIRDVQEHWPSLDYVLGPGAGLGQDVDPAYLDFVLRYM